MFREKRGQAAQTLCLESKNLSFDQRTDIQKLASFAACAKKNLLKQDSGVVLIGGVALRLLETVVGITNQGIFSGRDIDALLLSTDEEIRKNLCGQLNRLSGLPSVQLHRFLTPSEGQRAIFRQIVQDPDGLLGVSGLRGRVCQPISNLEIVEVALGPDASVLCASPSQLFHFYATRIPGGIKARDWKSQKPRRLLTINLCLKRDWGIVLSSPGELDGWRNFRREARRGVLPRLIITAVNFDGRIGRPWSSLGLATVIK